MRESASILNIACNVGNRLHDPQDPNFEIRTRATKSEPDYFYVNDYLKRLGEDSRKLF